MKKNIWFQILTIIAITVISGSVYNLYSTQGIDFIYTPLELDTGSNLDADQTYRLLREGKAVFIDARYEKEFTISHLPGAINIPSNLSREKLMSRLESIPRERMIVVYCGSEQCQAARRLAGLMTYLGFERVYVYLAGMEDWQARNYPLEK